MLLLRLLPLVMLVVLPNGTNNAVNLGSTEVNHNRVALPDKGVIETRKGTATFVQGHMIVRLEYRVKSFIVRSTVTLFYQAEELMRTLVKVSLSASHQAAVIDEFHTMSYYFRMLVARAGEQALRRLNYVFPREMEMEWRRKLARAKRGIANVTRTRERSARTAELDKANVMLNVSENSTPNFTETNFFGNIQNETHGRRGLMRSKRVIFDIGGIFYTPSWG